MVASLTTVVLRVFFLAAMLAGVSELWRYVLLVQSRTSALSVDVVALSDSLVIAASLFVFSFSVIPCALTLWWLFLAREVVAEHHHVTMARSTRQLLLGVLVPGFNLVGAGFVLAELEHAALNRSAAIRPKPSRLVRWWWAAWVANWLLLAVTVGWRLAGGVQAEANAVLTGALLDLSAGFLAVLTARVVRVNTVLLTPAKATERRWQVVGVDGVPTPDLRPSRSGNTAR